LAGRKTFSPEAERKQKPGANSEVLPDWLEEMREMATSLTRLQGKRDWEV
jgi:hypothetical protein